MVGMSGGCACMVGVSVLYGEWGWHVCMVGVSIWWACLHTCIHVCYLTTPPLYNYVAAVVFIRQ